MPFDVNQYFSRRYGTGNPNKLAELAQASQDKVTQLTAFQESKGEIIKPDANPNESSWVNQLGLNSNGKTGEAVNLAASFASGATRVAGQIASLPFNAAALIDESGLNDADSQSYARYKQDAATPEDMIRLSQRTNSAGAPTVLELFDRAAASRKTGLDITEFANTSKSVHQGKRDTLNKALGANFDSAWEQTKQGASNAADGDVLSGGANMLAGIGRLIYNAGEAALTNKAASAEYIVENIPQLLGGLVGKAGKAALTASNLGYGADLYSQGIKRYQEANDGAMPSMEQRQEMAMNAAGAVFAEQGSDLLQLSAIKAVGKAAKEGTEAVTRAGFKESLKNTLKAGGEGVASEAPTEGYQTYAEGQATLKPASPLEIYQGASIGGIAGGGLTGGGRAVAEMTGATPEKAAQRAKDQADTESFIANAKANNADAYLDESSKDYNPAKGIAVLFSHSQSADATAETKRQNVEKANDIISGLESKKEELQGQLDQMTPEGIQQRIDSFKARLDTAPPELASRIQDMVNVLQEDLANFDPKSVDQKAVKGIKAQMATLDRHMFESVKLRDQLDVLNKPQEADIEAAVASVDATPTTPGPEAETSTKAAADHVVSLAMAHPGSFSDDHLNRLVSNTKNGLSTEQRSYLRTLSESRIAENALKNLGIVASEVMNGDPAKNQLGIKDYQQRMADAIKSRNADKAATAVHMVGKFADAHKQKLRFFMSEFAKVGKQGAVNVMPSKQGWQLALTQDVSAEGQAANRKNGGMTISAKSVKLIRQIQAESKALDASRQQLQAAMALRFASQKPATPLAPAQTSVNQTASTQVVNSGEPSQAQAAPKQSTVDTASNQTNTVQNQSNVDSTVDGKVASTTTEHDPLTGDAWKILSQNSSTTPEELQKALGIGFGRANRLMETLRNTPAPAANVVVSGAPTTPKKPRQRIEPKDYQNIVGDILRITGGEGISSKVARDLLGDNTKHLKNVRPAVRANGWQDMGKLVEHLREAGYTQLNTEEDLAAMLRDHMDGTPGRTAAQIEEEAAASEERKAKEDEKAYRKAVNQEAKDKGIKQARGKRTLEHVLADLTIWEAKRGALEAEEERIAIQAEALFHEGNETELMQELADVAGYTNEEIESVRIENRESEERPVETAEGTTEAGRGDRENAGQAEEGKSTDAGKLAVFKDAVDFAGKKFGEAFKGINLFAHNLRQKASKGGKTVRPLVAEKDFLSRWLGGSISKEAIEGFVGEKLTGTQQVFLDHFLDTAAKWLPTITKNLVKGQVSAGTKYKKAIAAANKLPGQQRAVELARIEREMGNQKPGTISYSSELRYTNPIQYLIELNESGKADMEENVKTAIAAAAFAYVAENAKAPQMSSEDIVKGMFGISEYDQIDAKFYSTIAPLGNPEKTVIISMGQRAVQALGLSASKDASQEFLARLEADMGAHVMKLLVDQKVMERTVVSRTTLSAGLKHLKNHDASKQGSMGFLRMKRSAGKTAKARQLNPVAEGISSRAVATQGVLGKLFGVEAQVNLPSWEPVKVSQTTTANTDQAIPDELKKIVAHENSVANFVRKDVWTLLQGLGEEAFLEMAGYVEPDEAKMHKFSVVSTEVSNEALRRELSAAVEYFGSLERSVNEGGSELKLDQPLYLAHSIWKQQRVGIDGVINPQSSKIHRWMLTRADWKTTVSSTDLDNFTLRVAEGLGVKTDKQANVDSLTAAKELFNTESADPETKKRALILQAAVDALIASRQPGAEMSADQQKAILAGVKAGDEKMHSMDALIAQANYQEAKNKAGNADFSFDVQLMGEVDGVTNGPMLSHLLLGAGKDAVALLNRLNKGGFFQEGSGFQNYNVWRGTGTNTDLYEATISAVIATLSKQSGKAALFDRLQKITGTLYNKDTQKVEKDGRNIIKTPLTAMLFGSTVEGAVDSMFRDFIAKSYAGLEKIAGTKEENAGDQQKALNAYVDNLNALMEGMGVEKIAHNEISEFLVNFEFSETQEKALEAVFKDTLGVAVKETMESEFSAFLAIRDTINDTANATFGLYAAAYQGIRQNVIAELIKSGDIAAGAKKIDGKLVENAGDPLHDLTPEQERLIDERIAKLSPEVQTFMAKKSKNESAGLHISKSSRQLSQDGMYQNVSRFGEALPKTLDEAGNEVPGTLSLRNAAYQRILEMPGVAMVPMLIHSLDSAISHLALMGRQVLNIHDAHGTGLKGFIETAQALNKSTWHAVLNYSPAAEMRDSFKNTLLGMDALLQSGENKDAVIQNLQAYLKGLGDKHGTRVYGEKRPMPMDQVLAYVASEMFTTAYNSDKTKYEVLAQLMHVDQYALEGGQYDVTEADRAEAQARLDAMGKNTVPRSVWNAIDRINEVVLGISTSKTDSPYGELGKSSIDSDMELVHLFEDQPLQKAGDVAKQIMDKLSPANQLMLRKAMKLVGPDFPIQMLTSRTKDGAMGKQFNARGWFAYNGQKNAIYVLSPEFKASGLTPELLVHELLHAALAKTINHPNTPEAKSLVKSLNALVGQVESYLDANPELKAKYGFKLDAHELVSWGMSDLGFQQDVLAKVAVVGSSGAKITTALKRLVQSIATYLGLPLTLRTAEGQVVDNALGVLIQDVAGLFEQARNPKNGVATEAQSFAMASIQNMTTLDVYEALDDRSVTPTFDTHLRGLLAGITNKLHGPYGTFKAMVEAKMASTPKDLWEQAKGKGAAPFGSAALAAGISMNDQTAFVLEQVEASVHEAISANTGAAHDVYVELNKLYQEVRTKLESSNTLSPALQDFLFKMGGGAGNRSRHLARFAALGLAHPEVNAALKMGTDRAPLATGGSFAHRLEALFQKVLEWFNGRLTHTFAGQNADEKLEALVKQLVQIETKRKEPMLQKASALDFVENSLKQGSANLKSKVEKAARSKWIRDRKNSIVRTSGAVVSMIAGDRAEAVMNNIQAIRDRQMNQGFGLAMGVVNELRGMNDGNKMFHRLIREAKLREGIREDLIIHTGNTALESFANKGKDLTQQDKVAISAGLLRTDISSLLDHHSTAEIVAILNTPAALNSEIARLEKLLAAYPKARGYYERYAKNLGFKLATGKIKGPRVMMNAANIAGLVGTGLTNYVTPADVAAAMPIIDQLASLYAYHYTKDDHKRALSALMASETSRGNESGIDMVLKLHKSLQQQSKERLFEGSEALMMKGYTPEIYDPKKEVVVATEREGAALEAQGFVKGLRVSTDPTDPDKQDRFVYKRDGGGLRPWLTGIISYTGETAKGSRSKSDNVQNLTEWKANKQDLRSMKRAKQAAIQRDFRHDPSYDPAKVEENFAAPVVNAQGDTVDYRYLMSEDNKDDLLNRDSRFDKVLGSFAGNIYDKESTKESNRKAIQALHEQYLADFATRSESYRRVGPDSTDPELQDIYRMLPEDTKQAIRDVWGTEHMMVRSDLMDINFGYRKTSMTDAFHKEHKNVADRLFTGLFSHVWGEKAEYNLRRGEDIWQEIVAETKEILVIKNLSTLIGNIGSNISLLFWQGVPLSDMARYHRIALKGVSTYRADSAALIDMETKLAAGYITTSRAEMQREIVRLKDSLANNPVKELIDAGLMPSIVEDVSPDDDMYSYKSRLVDYVDEHSSKLNKHVLGVVKTVYMAKETKMYKALHHATQLSDFVARYALYAHVTSRKLDPMSKEEAVQLASDSFINYDLPSHRKLQYLNDMGFVQFTKYYLRIQKVINRLYAENPGRAMALLVTEHFFDSAPLLTDSGFVHKLGNNPFSLGALAYPGVLDELATVKAGAAVIR